MLYSCLVVLALSFWPDPILYFSPSFISLDPDYFLCFMFRVGYIHELISLPCFDQAVLYRF